MVNGGTSCYGLSAQRLRERGTAAHSTVEVDGPGFVGGLERLSGRPPRQARWASHSALRAQLVRQLRSHDGYRYLPGATVAPALWETGARRAAWSTTAAPAGQAAVARYRFAPGVCACWSSAPVLALHGGAAWSPQSSRLNAARPGPIGALAAPALRHLPRTPLPAVALVDGLALTRWPGTPMHILFLTDNFPPEVNAPSQPHARALPAVGAQPATR